MEEWKKFEDAARLKLSKYLNIKLANGKINIKGKEKNFDLLNVDKKVVGDVKYYKNTKSGNIPSAKRSIANEYIWLLQKCKGYRKIMVIGEDLKMAEKYVKDFSPWLNGVEIYFYRRCYKLKLLRNSKGVTFIND